MEEYHAIQHNFEPVYDKHSRILILGSFPSVKSREEGFYYGHPQNRFWRVLASLFDSEIPSTIEAKKKLLLDNHIALWDVIDQCDIVGSSDSSIKNVVPTDILSICKKCSIQKIYANGKTAEKLYQKYTYPLTRIKAIALPSTSPANAAYTMPRLLDSWVQILREDALDAKFALSRISSPEI